MANEKNDANQWFLRIAGGTVFGPVSTKGLIVWAEQGRIVPGNEVSNNRETWLPAEQVPELEMNWYVNAGSKTEGPFNRVAAESFLKSSKAPTDARLLHAKDVDLAARTRRTQVDLSAEPALAFPAPEAKVPPTTRNTAVKTAEAKTISDARDSRIAELELAIEKQRESVLQAKQAAKSQAALEDERDELRKQVQNLQAQLDNFRTNAEKDILKRERKLETMKQEVARLQREQAEAQPQPVLALDTIEIASDAKTEMANQQALADIRRQAEDEQCLREREADGLRARIQELDQQVASLTDQAGQREAENRKLSADRERLQQQLGSAMSEASAATNETADGDLRRRLEQLDAVTAGLRQELAQADQSLAAERAALAELLAASNERDLGNQQRITEYEQRLSALERQLQECGPVSERESRLSAEMAAARARIAELQVRLARLPEASASRTPEAAAEWLRQFAMDELTTLDKTLHEERDSFNHFRELSGTRQESIQSRIQVLQRLLSGEHPDGRRPPSHGSLSTTMDQTRRQCEVDSIRETQQKETKQFEERENELLGRIRLLETEEARLRSLLEATDMAGGKRIELMETVRRREQELAQERRNRDQDREQFQSAQQALLRRIEELERSAGISVETPPSASIPDTQSRATQTRRPASLGNWWKR